MNPNETETPDENLLAAIDPLVAEQFRIRAMQMSFLHRYDSGEEIAGRITESEWNELRAKYGKDKVFIILFPLDDEAKKLCVAYVRKPSFQHLCMAATQPNELLRGEILLHNAWLKGWEAIKTDDELLYAAVQMMVQLSQTLIMAVKKN